MSNALIARALDVAQLLEHDPEDAPDAQDVAKLLRELAEDHERALHWQGRAASILRALRTAGAQLIDDDRLRRPPMSDVIDLASRRATARPAPRVIRSGTEIAAYTQAAVHECVPLTLLVGALVRSGLTVTSVPLLGLVIHRIGQDPYAPADRPPTGA